MAPLSSQLERLTHSGLGTPPHCTAHRMLSRSEGGRSVSRRPALSHGPVAVAHEAVSRMRGAARGGYSGLKLERACSMSSVICCRIFTEDGR